MLHILVPIGVAVFPFVWYAAAGTGDALGGEMGIIENMTVLFLLIAICLAITSLIQARRHEHAPRMLQPWLAIMILGSVYFAGEELSWGQHFIGWNTPADWSSLNDQNETNLHNTSFLFDQLPRIVLTIAILFGGAIAPMYRKIRRIQLSKTTVGYWVFPTLDCLAASLLVLLFRPLAGVLGADFVFAGEMKENAIALFILIYVNSIRRKLKAPSSLQISSSPAQPG